VIWLSEFKKRIEKVWQASEQTGYIMTPTITEIIDEAKQDFLSLSGLDSHYSNDDVLWDEVKEKITKWFGDDEQDTH